MNKREQQKQATRQRLIATARELFSEQGLQVNAADIACAAQVSRATFYLHFTSINELLRELTQEIWISASELYTRFSLLPDWSRESLYDWLLEVSQAWQRDAKLMGVLVDNRQNELRSEYHRHLHEYTEILITASDERWAHMSPEEAKQRAFLLIVQLETCMLEWVVRGWPAAADMMLQTLADIWHCTLLPSPREPR